MSIPGQRILIYLFLFLLCMTKKYVLTGGPGIGKTTVLEELRQRGFYTIGESATFLIEGELLRGGDIVPWKNLYEFQKRVVENQNRWEREIPAERDVAFLDRGIHDGLAYVTMGNIATPPGLDEASMRYDGVFILDPLEGIVNTEV